MILDKLETFTGTSGQAVTSAATTVCTDSKDYGPLTVNTGRDLGTGRRVALCLTLIAGSVTTVTDPTVQLGLYTDDNTSFSSEANIALSAAVALPTTTGTLAAPNLGIKIILPFPPGAAYERYVRAKIITGGTITTASFTFDVSVVEVADTWVAKADNITIS